MGLETSQMKKKPRKAANKVFWTLMALTMAPLGALPEGTLDGAEDGPEEEGLCAAGRVDVTTAAVADGETVAVPSSTVR